MKIFNKKFAFIALLGLHVTMPISAQEDPYYQPTSFEVAVSPAIGIGMAAAAVYAWHTYLVREDYKVVTKYPHAQAWYDAMDKKYPIAQLNKKLFLQKIFILPVAWMSWCSTIQNIIFPQDALIRINSLYSMLENNQILSDEDQLFLAEQEFILLHEAGHIEHNDLLNKFSIMAGLSLGLGLVDNEVISSSSKTVINYLAINFLLSRYNERNADRFAYTHGDDNVLQGGIAFFESDKVDPLFNIENEKYSSFIETDSFLGDVTQFVGSIATVPTFYIGRATGSLVNSTYATRWMYDFCQGMSHPGAPTRVQAIREEIQRRLHAQPK